jgi:hypothetical protein
MILVLKRSKTHENQEPKEGGSREREHDRSHRIETLILGLCRAFGEMAMAWGGARAMEI